MCKVQTSQDFPDLDNIKLVLLLNVRRHRHWRPFAEMRNKYLFIANVRDLVRKQPFFPEISVIQAPLNAVPAAVAAVIGD